MAYTEDHIALAAEYALGTLDADERAQVETMMAVDEAFAAIVQAWAYRLGVLNQMVGSVEPRPIVWENIKAEIARTALAQQPPVLADIAPPPIPPVEAALPEAPSEQTPQSPPPKRSSPSRCTPDPMRLATLRPCSCRRSTRPIPRSCGHRLRRSSTTAMSFVSRGA